MTKSTRLPMKELAARIQAHLSRMEASESNPGSGNCQYWHATAYPAGAYVSVKYKSFWNGQALRRDDAEVYLAWLDAGNDGKHYKALDAALPVVTVTEPRAAE